MKNISCNTIQDLLPLYVENMLSNDSIQLVEEHVKDCPECNDHLIQLREEAFDQINQLEDQRNGEKNIFKKIKRRILVKRFLSAFTAILILVFAARIGYYFYAEKGTYITLEDSGLSMEGDKLYATKPYLGKLRSYYSADQHTIFLIMVDTAKANHDYPEQNVNGILFDFADQIDPADMDQDELYEDRLSGIETVYYLPEEYTNFQFDTDDPEHWEEQSKEAMQKSTVLWRSTK